MNEKDRNLDDLEYGTAVTAGAGAVAGATVTSGAAVATGPILGGLIGYGIYRGVKKAVRE